MSFAFITRYVVLLGTVVSSLVFSTQVHALTLSPAKVEMSGDKGKTISGEFLILNEQSNSMTFYTSAENFEAQGESGTPHFTQGDTGVASWIKVQEKVVLEKGEQKVVPFTITIPTDADAGGHFAAIFLSTTAPEISGGGQVSVGAKVGVLVLLRVSGEVSEKGGIVGFSSLDTKRVWSTLPIQFIYRFQNTGGDRIKPEGNVIIKNILGWEKETINANQAQGNILPNSTRKFDVIWGGDIKEVPQNFFGKALYQLKNFAFGVYKANVALTYGEKENKAHASYVVVVIPWQLLSLVFAVLIVGGFIGLKGIKKYNQWIIQKARMSS